MWMISLHEVPVFIRPSIDVPVWAVTNAKATHDLAISFVNKEFMITNEFMITKIQMEKINQPALVAMNVEFK
jgi:hypothetical protein